MHHFISTNFSSNILFCFTQKFHLLVFILLFGEMFYFKNYVRKFHCSSISVLGKMSIHFDRRRFSGGVSGGAEVSERPLSRDKQNSSSAVAATPFSSLLCNAVISPNCRCKKQFAIDVSED